MNRHPSAWTITQKMGASTTRTQYYGNPHQQSPKWRSKYSYKTIPHMQSTFIKGIFIWVVPFFINLFWKGNKGECLEPYMYFRVNN